KVSFLTTRSAIKGARPRLCQPTLPAVPARRMLPLRFIRALIVLHRTFGSLPLKARLHMLLRFLSAPLLRVAREVPAGALLLDLGAGHGVFARLALEAGARRVVAVEPDIRKIFGPLGGIDFVAGYDACVRGTFDAVAIVD